MKRERVSDMLARRYLSSALNLQIEQQERYIRENCSFFAFVGPPQAFPAPRQINRSISPIEIGGMEVGRAEPSYVDGNAYVSSVQPLIPAQAVGCPLPASERALSLVP